MLLRGCGFGCGCGGGGGGRSFRRGAGRSRPLVWAPPPTMPFAAICCWIYCLSSGEMLFAVQPWLLPPPAPIERMLIDTPQTFAATLIGIWALIGIFDLSILRSSARSLSTLLRLTLTSEAPAPATSLRRRPPRFPRFLLRRPCCWFYSRRGQRAPPAKMLQIRVPFTSPVTAAPTRKGRDCFERPAKSKRDKLWSFARVRFPPKADITTTPLSALLLAPSGRPATAGVDGYAFEASRLTTG